MDRKINIRLNSGFDSSGINEARQVLSAFHARLMESNKSLLEINARLSGKMHSIAQSIAVDYGTAADKAVKGMGRIYETLDQINARVDAPKKAARYQAELNEELKRYCDLCDRQRRAEQQRLASWKSPKSQWNQGPGAGSLYKPANNSLPGGTADFSGLASGAYLARKSVPALLAIDRIAGNLDGTIGKVAHGLQGIIGLGASFGPMGAAIGAAFAAIDAAASAYADSQMKALRKMEEWYAQFDAYNKQLRDNHFEKLAKDVDAVAEAAKHSAEMFELAAAKRAEFAEVRKGMDAALAATELLDMQRQMSEDVAWAADAEKGRVAAAWRLQIADREVDLRKRAAEVAADSEREALETAKKRLELAERSMRSLAEAEVNAAKEYNNVRDAVAPNSDQGERDAEILRYKAEYEKAQARRREAAKNYDRTRADLEVLERRAEVEAVNRENSVAQALGAAEEASYAYDSAERDYAMKWARELAAERERLDRELHQKRMDDLRAEIAAQKEAESPLQAAASAARSEFERAFAMYRDPSRAATEIGEERDRAEDLKRLHRDASRYGGKWRIDELSALMSAGDTEGVKTRLEDWRKSRSFTPEVEAMVRASAAEKTETTATDELRKIEANTSGLAQKLDELLKMKE